MEILINFIENFWNLSLTIGIYVLIGLVFVGIVHLYISQEWIEKHLGKNSRYPAFKGALYGIPLPLCSCGVIPLAASLRKKGASKKAVTSFFITTPMTGVDSIIATYGVLGMPMAVLRVLSSFISGLAAGIFVKESKDETGQEQQPSCFGSSCCSPNESKEKNGFQKAWDYSIYEVFSDLAKPMFYGLVLASLFIMIIPNDGIDFLNKNMLIAYILVFIIAIPIYVCSISAIPIALSMLAVGVSPGTAFIFLAAAPATNIITAGVIKKIMGNNALIIYLTSIISVTIFFALMIDFIFPEEWFSYMNQLTLSETTSWIDIGGAVVFLSLMFYFIIQRSFNR